MSMTGAMLTSLKVVRMALVDCDWIRRSAMRARRRLIGTRCSGRSPRFCAVGAATAGSGLATAAGTGAATGAGTAAGLAPPATAASTSPLVTRPSLPEPATSPTARPLSASSLAAAGIATSPFEPPVAVGTAAATGAADGTATTCRGLTPAWPSVSTLAMSWSLTTVPPSGTTIWASTPAAGAGTSSTTLSVSISIRISSMATASPGFFFHVSRVASATDSESWGTLTSTMAMMGGEFC